MEKEIALPIESLKNARSIFFHFEGVFFLFYSGKRNKKSILEIESIINEAFELDIYMDLTW